MSAGCGSVKETGLLCPGGGGAAAWYKMQIHSPSLCALPPGATQGAPPAGSGVCAGLEVLREVLASRVPHRAPILNPL